MPVNILVGDCRQRLQEIEAGSVRCCVTSPPYWNLRDYNVDGQIGLEQTPEEWCNELVAVFREVRRVLTDDGTLWLNLGDSYAANRGYQVPDSKHTDVGNAKGMRATSIGLKPKDLVGAPWMVAFALRADGWFLRQEIIWHKPNPMPESVTDRPTRTHEQLFLLAKSQHYHYNAEAIEEPCSQNTHARISQDVAAQLGSERANGGTRSERPMKAVVRGSGNKERKTGEDRGRPGSHLGGSIPWQPRPKAKAASDGVRNNASFEAGISAEVLPYRNKRSVWLVPTEAFRGAHFATFPPALIEPCILAGSEKGDTILDPFGGAGTTALVADRLGRNSVLCELNPDYAALAEQRIRGDNPLFATVTVSP
jgi:DNA modification methylase